MGRAQGASATHKNQFETVLGNRRGRSVGGNSKEVLALSKQVDLAKQRLATIINLRLLGAFEKPNTQEKIIAALGKALDEIEAGKVVDMKETAINVIRGGYDGRISTYGESLETVLEELEDGLYFSLKLAIGEECGPGDINTGQRYDLIPLSSETIALQLAFLALSEWELLLANHELWPVEQAALDGLTR